jgi:hypothetical protein
MQLDSNPEIKSVLTTAFLETSDAFLSGRKRDPHHDNPPDQ